MSKQHIALSEKDISRIINGEEIAVKFKDEEIIVRQSYMKDIEADTLNRKYRIVNTASSIFNY